MAAGTMLPDLAIGFAETMANRFETGGIEELSTEEVSTAIRMCAFLQDLFAQARRSLSEELSQGVDARAFAAKYERAVTGLEALLSTAHRMVTIAPTNGLPPPTAQFLSSYRALMDDVVSFHHFLAEAVAKAKLPIRPINWERVQQAEAAYARNETKPFQRSPES